MELNKVVTTPPPVYPVLASQTPISYTTTATTHHVPVAKKKHKSSSIPLLLVGLLILITIGLSAAILAIVLKKTNDNINASNGTNIITVSSSSKTLVDAIRTDEIMAHLRQLQDIANKANGTRAIGTIGFNNTIDYIHNYLTQNTNLLIQRDYFPVSSFTLNRDPILIAVVNGIQQNYTYRANFTFMQYSASASFSSPVRVTNIPNLGCSADDWNNASPHPARDSVALVKRGDCAFVDKSDLAAQYGVAALLLYNDGASPDRLQPVAASVSQGTTFPALFLSFGVGTNLSLSADDNSSNVGVLINIAVKDEPPQSIANVCADTPTGDKTKTIVVGSHSDSVPAGSGINDNGSGTSANLALATNVARLLQTADYKRYQYRIRFCWWGAEEVGLLGSTDHVNKAKNKTEVGERIEDYLVNLNFDMLGSPNFIFGVYDADTANRNTTPAHAIPGSQKLTDLFSEYFKKNSLPWTKTDFSGRSDYGPFLAAGITAGGLFSGGDDIKSQKERDYYDQMLGQGQGGIVEAIHDPCYHKQCDTIQNINPFAYTKMVHAAAYVLEFLGHHDDLQTWLYPPREIELLEKSLLYNSNKSKYSALSEFYKKHDL
ncbi:unnamed protein product [Didymodactylos carnosus]|uniref:Peptide hydrolase n=1 Tax=Didymodactylos carnosus TaxID=1234261 RepID=A0A815EB89_9BILA|nr:unnamed protein product [Didymodactylos carnosus]CAF4142393.1 unnamed protein product [Didymodactylos carnosus]